MKFINVEHEERFKKLIKKGSVSARDIERVVAMFIIAGNEGLYDKSDELYDFKKSEFIFDLVEDGKDNFKIKWKKPLSSSESKLITLAFDMYSSNNNVCIVELFNTLDSQNTELALRAIRYRFNR